MVFGNPAPKKTQIRTHFATLMEQTQFVSKDMEDDIHSDDFEYLDIDLSPAAAMKYDPRDQDWMKLPFKHKHRLTLAEHEFEKSFSDKWKVKSWEAQVSNIHKYYRNLYYNLSIF